MYLKVTQTCSNDDLLRLSLEFWPIVSFWMRLQLIQKKVTLIRILGLMLNDRFQILVTFLTFVYN